MERFLERRIHIARAKKFRNEYIIDGDITTVILKQRNGNEFHTMIDTEDLPKLINYEYSWSVKMHPVNKEWYAFTKVVKEEGSKSTTMLQSFLLDTKGSDIHIDHINHDTLDNRKCNLRVTNVFENLRNRKGKNITNTSGYRNVSPSRNGKWWVVTLRVNGKQSELARFSDVDDAGQYAKIMRQKYYGEFAGEGIGYSTGI